jgi:hypothetical protein
MAAAWEVLMDQKRRQQQAAQRAAAPRPPAEIETQTSDMWADTAGILAHALGYALGCSLAGGCHSGSYDDDDDEVTTLRRAPDGSYVTGAPRLAPDGSYVGGCPRLAPDGSYVGTGQE